jgi:hypothetical protein
MNADSGTWNAYAEKPVNVKRVAFRVVKTLRRSAYEVRFPAVFVVEPEG